MSQENNINEKKQAELMPDELEKGELKAESKKGEGKKPFGKKPQGQNKQSAQGTGNIDPDYEERVVSVARVAKVVKGGRRFSFSALIIVGDKKGNVGYGLGKAKEVPEAIRKATQSARRHMIKVPVDKGTIPHSIMGEYDAGKIYFKPAADGTGIKAAGACRSILELSGIRNVLTKSLRGSNPHNIVKATFKALRQLRSVEQIAKARDIDPQRVRIK